MTNSFYTLEEIEHFGFKSVGSNVLISRFARFYSVENIEIGNNVRIDDFSIISGNIKLKNNIHISAFCALYGKYGIEIDNYAGLSPRCTLLSASDDFGGDYLISPMVSAKYTNVQGGRIVLNKYVQIGAGSIIMPNVIIEEGVAVGAMSFVKKSLSAWKIYAGNPLKLIKQRNHKLLNMVGKIEENEA
jgi:acetyltransferase-like isoleucine patch superfamily enzyme